jgi:hypothetical protein
MASLQNHHKTGKKDRGIFIAGDGVKIRQHHSFHRITAWHFAGGIRQVCKSVIGPIGHPFTTCSASLFPVKRYASTRPACL